MFLTFFWAYIGQQNLLLKSDFCTWHYFCYYILQYTIFYFNDVEFWPKHDLILWPFHGTAQPILPYWTLQKLDQMRLLQYYYQASLEFWIWGDWYIFYPPIYVHLIFEIRIEFEISTVYFKLDTSTIKIWSALHFSKNPTQFLIYFELESCRLHRQ